MEARTGAAGVGSCLAFGQEVSVELTIDFSEDGRRVTAALVGAVDSESIHHFNRALEADPRFRADLTILIDVTGAEISPDPQVVARVQAATSVLHRDWLRPPRAIAFVARDEDAARELELWRAQLGGSESRRAVFLSREDAEAWLDDRSAGPARST